MHTTPPVDRRGNTPPPRFFSPSVGRRCRMFASRAAADQYHQGWLNPEDHKPAACGTPAQVGALDRLMFERDQAREQAAYTAALTATHPAVQGGAA